MLFKYVLFLITNIAVNAGILQNPIPLLNDVISKIDVLNVHNKLSGQSGQKDANEGSGGNFEANSSFSQVCYGVLGCFGRKDFYSPFQRPISLLPRSPEEMNVSFSLYTGDNKFVPKVMTFDLKREEIEDSSFDPSKPTKFIVHGFHGSYDDMQWMGDIKDLIFLLDADQFNVFGVDWSNGASSLLYNQAAANTRVVGAAVAYFINKLVEYKGIDVTNVHLIGHSLGAHVSGYAGQRFENPKIGRITGLDPAGPAFQKDLPASRLEKSDALYVEALHTDAGDMFLEGLGLKDSIGHDDYYPNGGSKQPGCGLTKGAFNVLEYGIGEGITNTIACNHQRSWQMILVNPETIEEKCQFVGYECDSYSDFLAGNCADCGEDGSKCGLFNLLGERDPRYGEFLKHQYKRNSTSGRKLFFSTSEQKPYCLHHYRIAVHFDEEMPRSATGSISLNLIGSRRTVNDISMSDLFSLRSFSAGKSATTLVTFSKTLGAVDKIELKWSFSGIHVFDPTKLISKPKLHVSKIEVNYLSHIDPKRRNKFSTILCPVASSEIESGEMAIFEKCS